MSAHIEVQTRIQVLDPSLNASSDGSQSNGNQLSIRTSAVIVTYNSELDIDSCLSAFASTDTGLVGEVIVVDNASVDDTLAIVGRHPDVKLIRRGRNDGFAAAVNQGIASSSTDYVLILNPDVVVTAHAVSALMSTLERNNEYAAVGCRMIFPDGRQQLSARPFPTIAAFVKRAFFTNSFANRLNRSSQLDGNRNLVESSQLRQVDWILGGCMMIRRSAYTSIGPLDERYFLYYEEIDWCYRAHLSGWKIGLLTGTCVIHDYKRTSSKISLANRLTWIHLTSACRFFVKFARVRRLRTII